MRLTQLQIRNFRNITDVEIIPDPGVNLITGDNAAGKTSLLEAIYYLSHVRSFRTQYVTDLIKRETNYLQITAQANQNVEQSIPFGIRRSRNKAEIRVDRQPIKRVSDIAAKLPVLAIHPDSYKLITGSPTQRRQYMDWGVFHVEHEFFHYWQRFRKSVSQRNAALKSRQTREYCQLWDKDIIHTATAVDAMRTNYISQLQAYFQSLAALLFPDDDIHIEYKRGWSLQENLQDLLVAQFDRDRMKGYTYYGPHRAEINIKVNGQSAQTGISRGQQKTLVALLRLAQAQHFTQSNGQLCILLYDDLAAELDVHHREIIMSVLATMNLQLFITAIERSQINLDTWPTKKMFHVEHGCLQDLI